MSRLSHLILNLNDLEYRRYLLFWLFCFSVNLAEAKSQQIFQRRLVDHMEILVTEAEKQANGTLNIREHFTVYLVETKLVF